MSVSLDKGVHAITGYVPLNEWESEILDQVGPIQPKITPRPWYPLVGHREGLRSNDLVTLASALFILSLEGGTAH